MASVFRNRALVVATTLVLFAASLHAGSVPQNLGLGLQQLVESQAMVKANPARATFGGYATEQAQNFAAMAIVDETGDRVMVDIVARGTIGVEALAQKLQSQFASFEVKSVDAAYRGAGVIEAYLSVDEAAALSQTVGVRSVFLALKPYTRSSNKPLQMPSVVNGDQLNKIGTAFDQGVIEHRVDRINQLYNPTAPVNYDGTGISIGILSDSYDTRTATPHAAFAVTNFDLPGAASNPWNTQPVVVLQDSPAGTDEGRGMAEIAYKMAPKSRLAFASANFGEVGFANNIRALAALPGYEYSSAVQQGFKADVIADDVGYFDEPWYQDGVISDGIDDVAAAGVSYFSSAANDIGINGYESTLRIVPNGTGNTSVDNTALVNTNISLVGVPASLYAGGFHNFNPDSDPSKQDVAQLVNYTGTQYVIMQWDDPYDTSDLVMDQPPIYSSGGTISPANPSVTFDQNSTPSLPQFTAGQAYVISETATSGDLDGIINIYDGMGNLILSQDTGTDEIVNFFAPASGQYKIVVNGYSTSAGDFTFTVNTAQGNAGVTTDLNLLVFRADTGAFISASSLTSNNLATNRPIELGRFKPPTGQTKLQFVIARANSPTAAQLPTRVRWLIPGNGAANLGPAEYFKYDTVTTGGHATAAGCNGTAAYAVFRPNLPEYFTSPGPATILFDKQSKRLGAPEVRQQPRIAASDAANTSFFGTDSLSDLDTNQNFSGTSAAAPHAAAIAALVLQSRGGPRSVSPEQMTSILQSSTFPHDLDPSFASGTAMTTDGGSVVIAITSDGDTNPGTGYNDPSSFKVTYTGPGSLASLTFNPAGIATGGGNVTGGNNGPQDNIGSSPATITYFENNYPGLAFLPTDRSFLLGPLDGLVAADITAPLSATPYTGFSNPSPPPGNGTSFFQTMTIGFPTGNFVTGAAMRFTVGRGAQHSATTGNGTIIGPGTVTRNAQADLFGGGVMIPSGIVINDGMTFSGTTTAGGVFTGTIRNNIGHGYSIVDGYGFIDASRATGTLQATATATPDSGYVGDSTVFTVTVMAGTSPASTAIVVSANLSGVGGPATQTFYDDGTHGDAAAGDNVFSFGMNIGNTGAGTKLIPIVVTDAQARSGNAQVNFTVLAPTAPSGIAAATPASVSVTESTLLTVQVTPGAGPASTGISVTADLSSIGGSASQVLIDDGTSSGTYAFTAVVALGIVPGAKSLPVIIADAQSRSATANIALTVLTPTMPTGVAAASPDSAPVTGATLITVVVSSGTNPTSSGVTVTADLSPIGGSATQALYDDGTNGDATASDGTYSFATNVGSVASGPKVLSITIADAQGRQSSTGIAFNVQSQGALSGTGLSTPTTVNEGGTAVLIVSVVSGTNPASTGLTVTVDLSAIGGSATQVFYDDGSNGDQVAGDGIFTFTMPIALDAAPGSFSLPVAINDAQSRTATAAIAISITDVIFRNGFE